MKWDKLLNDKCCCEFGVICLKNIDVCSVFENDF